MYTLTTTLIFCIHYMQNVRNNNVCYIMYILQWLSFLILTLRKTYIGY